MYNPSQGVTKALVGGKEKSQKTEKQNSMFLVYARDSGVCMDRKKDFSVSQPRTKHLQ